MSSNTPVAEMSRWDLGREGGSPFLGSRDEPLGPGREGGSPFLGSRDEPLGPGREGGSPFLGQELLGGIRLVSQYVACWA